MHLLKRPNKLPERQAIAAVGQAGLIMEYEKAFSRYNKSVAQILLTGEGLSNRKRYLNARNTICTLLSWHIVPIINENDSVSVEEIQFGDNDNLAAMITMLMDADILINITDIDGLYTKDPRINSDAEMITVVNTINKNIEHIASNIPGALGTGGMLAKIKAAKKLTVAGVPMVIASGEKPDILINLFSGKEQGTFFVPKKEKLASRKCWLVFNSKSKGTLIIDDGAAKAIINKGKSLLPGGILKVEGEFSIGSPVEFKKTNSKVLGIGLVNYSATDIRMIMGLKSCKIMEKIGHKPYDEVIHRNNLALRSCD